MTLQGTKLPLGRPHGKAMEKYRITGHTLYPRERPCTPALLCHSVAASQRHTEARDIYRAEKLYTSIYAKAAKKYAIHRIDVRNVVEGGLEMNAQGCDM